MDSRHFVVGETEAPRGGGRGQPGVGAQGRRPAPSSRPMASPHSCIVWCLGFCFLFLFLYIILLCPSLGSQLEKKSRFLKFF